jgi:beta-N-acetylhexosaminidase
LLREDLGFDGLLVSDALDMAGASGGRGIPAAAVLALKAGVDLLCLGSSFTDERVQEVQDAVVAAVDAGDLPRQRLDEAAGRVHRASEQLLALRAASTSAPDPEASRRAARAAVDGSPARAGTWRGAQVLRLVTGTNEAVGRAPWGLPAGGLVLSGTPVRDVVRGDEPWHDLGPEPVVVLVRDGHRHEWAQQVIDQVLRRRPDAVVVEMGWPSQDPAEPGRLRTWGASAASAVALDELLAGVAP